MIKVYGIKNCDTIKKALKWLADNGVEHQFHDYRKNGLDADWLSRMEGALGWENLLNRRGTTWRKLPADVQENIDRDSALAIMLENPAIIKRPLFDLGDQQYLGFAKKDQEFLADKLV